MTPGEQRAFVALMIAMNQLFAAFVAGNRGDTNLRDTLLAQAQANVDLASDEWNRSESR